MKNTVVLSVFVISLFFWILPLVIGNMEKEELGEQTRRSLNGGFVELSAGVTHYEVRGEAGKKTIVLVHGNAAPLGSWDNTVDALVGSGFRVLRYDLFGHGFSDRPNLNKYNRELYDKQLFELLEKLSITRPVYIAGTSQGASIGTYFAARHPERVEKLALLSPFFDDFEGDASIALLKVPVIGEYIIRLLGDRKLVDPSNVLYSDRGNHALVEMLKKQLYFKGKKRAVLANLRGNALDDATEFYAEVKVHNIPMLLTWGQQDGSISGRSMIKLKKLIPMIEYNEFEGAGHLVHYEFPERMNPVLINFFKNS